MLPERAARTDDRGDGILSTVYVTSSREARQKYLGCSYHGGVTVPHTSTASTQTTVPPGLVASHSKYTP